MRSLILPSTKHPVRSSAASICYCFFLAILPLQPAAAEPKSDDAALTLQISEDFHSAEKTNALKPLMDEEASYRSQLEKFQKTAQDAGNLKSVLAAKEAITELDAGRPPLVSDDAGLAAIQKTHIARRQKAETLCATALAKVDQDYLASLKKLVAELTKAGKIDQAVEVQAKVDGLAATLSPQPVAATPTPKAEEIEIWKKKALEEFPALKQPESELSKSVKALSEKKKATNPSFFNNPQWPYLMTKEASFSLLASITAVELPKELPAPDGKEADVSRPVQVYILMGEADMVGLGSIPSLKAATKMGKYPYLVDDSGAWTVRKDVRNVFMMTLDLQYNNWMSATNRNNVGLEYGIGYCLGHAIDAPVMILKSCNGNRSLGWDLLPPGSEPYEFEGKMVPGYRGTPDNPKGNGKKLERQWYAGKQYDLDVEGAKKVLSDLGTYYPGAKKYEVAGFFFWQGDKDRNNAGLASRYEQNLVHLIETLRKEFNAPNSKFVCATLGQTKKGATGNEGLILDAQLAVDGNSGKFLKFKGNVATIYSHPLSRGGSSKSNYDGNAETYMNIGEAMGRAMAGLIGIK